MFTPKNILVPTDFSPLADLALKKAVDIAQQHKAKIFLLHVIDEKIVQCAADYCLSDDFVKQMQTQSLQQAKENLKKEAEAIAAKKVTIVFDVQKGRPEEVILQEQKAKDIDLIVIASHGRTGISKFLTGSVTERVVRGAACSVMVVKS